MLGLEIFYTEGTDHGIWMEHGAVDTVDEALATLGAAIRQAGFSNARVVNIDELPEPAREHWISGEQP